MSINDKNRQNLLTIGSGFLQFAACGLVFAGLILVIRWQSRFGMSSESVIEWAQSIVLGASLACFYIVAAKCPRERAGLLLIAGFLTALFIREQDGYLDVFSRHAWQYVLVAFLVPLFWYIARRGWSEALEGLAGFIRSRFFVSMAVGMALLLIFSRLHGSEQFVWSLFIKNWQDCYTAKRLSEETMELLAYLLVAHSSFGFLLERLSCRESRGGPEVP